MPKQTNENFKRFPHYWFVQLAEGRREGDNQKVSEAQQKLRELGYNVTLCQPAGVPQ